MTQTPSFDLTGRTAIVTGASRGIGRAIAEGLLAAGARLTISSRTQESLDTVAREMRSVGGEVLPKAAHTGHADEVEALVAATAEHFGSVDIVVNNAATNPFFGPTLEAEPGHWDKTLEVNVKGYANVIKSAVPHMRRAGGGKVVSVASVAAVTPMAGLGVYSVTKAAVVMLTRVLAVELAPDNIQVNALAPGMIKTRFSAAMWKNPELHDTLVDAIPAHRMGTPEDLAGAALYLVSPASDYTTGQVVTVDGGLGLGALR